MMELLAPAGNPEALEAAVKCGADAVYIGGRYFSARQNASNFDMNDIRNAADFCHLHNVKLHIAMNTIIFDSQLEEFADTAVKYAKMGADAFIVQDIGAAECIHRIIPDIPLHASTQMTIHTVKGAETAKNLGFERVVLSRELSYEQISEISRLNIETEVFVHGALCMSVSGQCYMSAMIGSRSANRGLCAQPCRLPFSACKNRDFNALSLKDLCLAEHIRELENAGVTSLKIEGRMKRPEYVAAAVTEFRKALDGRKPDTQILKSVFSRSGFTDGYFTGKRNDMFGSRSKEDVLSASKVFPQIHELYRRERKCGTADFRIIMKKDTPALVHISDRCGNSADISGDIPQTALKRPADNESLSRQFSKLGDTVYNFGNLEYETDSSLMLPASSLNQMRRNATAALDSERIKKNTPSYRISEEYNFNFPKFLNLKYPSVRISINKLKQIEKADISGIQYIAVPADEIIRYSDRISDDIKNKIIIKPPAFITDEKKTEKMLSELKNIGFKRLVCSNIAYISTGKKYGFEMHGSFRLNISNSCSLEKFAELGLADTVVSAELKINQIRSLADFMQYGTVAYGRFPLMLVRNCPIKNEIGCGKCTGHLTDRTGRKFPVLCCQEYAEILNPEKIYMADRLSELSQTDFLLLLFTDESPQETADIIKKYISASDTAPAANITRGLLYRGVE